MPNNFKETTKNLKEIIDNLDKKREYEFHFHSADGADVTSRFGDVTKLAEETSYNIKVAFFGCCRAFGFVFYFDLFLEVF